MTAKFRGAPPKKAAPPALPPAVLGRLQQALALHQQGQLAQAIGLYQEIRKAYPRHFDTLHMLGVATLQSGDGAQGVKLIAEAIKLNPQAAAAHNNLANALKNLGRLEEALKSYDQALALTPGYGAAHANRGNTLLELERPREALAAYDQALVLEPQSAEAYNGRGNAHHKLGALAAALRDYDQALALLPNLASAYSNRSQTLRSMGLLEAALDSADQALRLTPGLPQAHLNRGNALFEMGRLPEALASFEQAAALRPDLADVHRSRGTVLASLRQLPLALEAFEQTLRLKPDYPYLLGDYLHTLAKLCLWSRMAAPMATMVGAIGAGQRAATPFPVLSLVDDPALHQAVAVTYGRSEHYQRRYSGGFSRGPSGKIRLAYFSADFHDHPVAHAIAGLFAAHDRQQFELFGFSMGPDRPGDAMRARLVGGFDQFVDISRRSDEEAAALARSLGIDIAIDLGGYTTNSRPGLFAHGCAPVQVNFLGYPGTLGVDSMDYIIADKTVIPLEDQGYYQEKVAYLPHSYLANDCRRPISDKAFTRADFGLPEAGVVFCSFNNNYKILPEVFERWCRILQAVAGSVLWLRFDNEEAADSLRREAAARGVEPGRLIFAHPLEQLSEHLARQRLADLFLDTLPYNAHSTASDALWAGLPVLTCRGRSFPGRVAASLLGSAGLPELVAEDGAEYEAKAIALARQPQQLAELKARLRRDIGKTPLFDGLGYARSLEAAFRAMHARRMAGLVPAMIEVTAGGGIA